MTKNLLSATAEISQRVVEATPTLEKVEADLKAGGHEALAKKLNKLQQDAGVALDRETNGPFAGDPNSHAGKLHAQYEPVTEERVQNLQQEAKNIPNHRVRNSFESVLRAFSPSKIEKGQLPKTRGQKFHDRMDFWGLGYLGVFLASAGFAHFARHGQLFGVGQKFEHTLQKATNAIDSKVPDKGSGITHFLKSPLHANDPANTRLKMSVYTTLTIFALHWGGNVMLPFIKNWDDRKKAITNWFDRKFGTGLDAETEKRVLEQPDEKRFGVHREWKDWIKARALTMGGLVFPTGIVVSLIGPLDTGLTKLTNITRRTGLAALNRTEDYASAMDHLGKVKITNPDGTKRKFQNYDSLKDPSVGLPPEQQKAVGAARWLNVAAFDIWYTALTAFVLFATSKIFAKRRESGKQKASADFEQELQTAEVPKTTARDQTVEIGTVDPMQTAYEGGSARKNDLKELKTEALNPEAKKAKSPLLEGPKDVFAHANRADVSPSLP